MNFNIFDIAISIGINCQCRYNISRTLYLREHGNTEGFILKGNKNTVNDYGSYFFDWSFTPFESLISILESNFTGVLQLPNLVIKMKGEDKQTVLDLATGCSYPHTFQGTSAGKLTEQKLESLYPKVSEKYSYLVNKTKSLLASDKKILFVLTGNFTADNIEKLIKVLQVHTSNFMILYTPWKNQSDYHKVDLVSLSHKRLIVRPILNKPYPGDCASWDDAFRGIKLAV